MTTRIADVAVVGTGAIGCAAAYQLTARGLAVVLIGRNGIASDASGKAWGGLTAHFGAGVPGNMLERYRLSTRLHRQLYEDHKDTLPPELDWKLRPVSSISLAMDESELSGLRESATWKSDNGFNAQVIDGDAVREIEPAVTADAIGGMLTNTEWELDCPTYSNALVKLATRQGCQLVDAEVQAIDTDSAGGVSITAPNATLSVRNVVLATGPWVHGIRGMPSLPVRPVKGEILRVNLPGNDFTTRVGYGGRNVGRKPDGLVWLGTYEQDSELDDEITQTGRDLIMSTVSRYIPSIQSSEVMQQTACLRPATPDGIPIVGPIADGMIVANGAGKKGILLSLWIGGMIADYIADGVKPPADLAPDRFGEV